MPSEDPSNIDASTHHDSPDLTDSQATIPLTPEYYGSCNHYMIGAGHEHNDDFARLIPVNESACIAFDDLAAKFKRDYYWNKHARQYVHIDETKKDIQFIPSESDTETESPKESISRWTGYYRFSLSIPPRDIRLGWLIGSGRQDQVVDLLLTDKHRQYQIRGIHARVTHKSSSNVLLIMTDHKRKITLNGTQEIEGNQRVLWDWETGVTIGDLVYKLQLLKVDEHEYQEQLLQLRKTAGIYTHEPPITLDPTPSEKKYLYSDYIIDKPFDSGSTCTVLSGVHKITGVAYAVKKIVRTSKNSALIKWEVDVMKAIGSHHRLCNLVAEIYTGGNNEGLGANKFDEVLLVYSPLAQNRCSTLLKSPDLSPDDRAILLKQWLEGIAFLHTRGLIHRDINPNNMVVVSRRPPRGVLIDLGAATWEQSSTNHMAGTIPFLAPEVMALKLSLSSPPYDKTVDIWSFGITSYLLICQRFPFWKEMDRSTYTKIREELLAKGRDPIIALTEQMLRWNPRDRISAADAVLHPALRNVDAGAESKERLGSK